MELPVNFKWIDTIGVLPKMVQEGIRLLGITEAPGTANNPAIIEMAVELGVADIYKSDSTQPWCALSHCVAAKRAGKTVTFTDKYDFLRALAFAKQGDKFNTDVWQIVERTESMFGDSMIFSRPGGGHVGMNVGESPTHFYVMGGNQNNQYSFTRVAKERLYAVRRPIYGNVPPSVKKYILTDTGTPVTSNEL